MSLRYIDIEKALSDPDISNEKFKNMLRKGNGSLSLIELKIYQIYWK